MCDCIMKISILIPSKDEPKVHEVVEAIDKHTPAIQAIVCNDPEGYGKGWAVRQGLLAVTGDVIGIIDGDMDIHPRMFARMIPYLEDYDIVVGKKQIRGSLTRRMVTRLSRIFIRTLFGMDYDTQTGIKLFKKEAIPEWKNDDFMFDLEVIIKAYDAGFKIIEVPVEVTPYGSTSKTIKGKNLFKCFKEVLIIWRDRI